MAPPIPVVTDHFTLVGVETKGGHTFHLHVEEPIPGHTAMRHGEITRTNWLRAACSCGWRAASGERCSIEENAHHVWWEHVTRATS